MALPAYLATIGEWRTVDPATTTDAQLLSDMRALALADARYWFHVAVVMGVAKVTDGLLNAFLTSRLVPGNLTSGVFLLDMGVPIRIVDLARRFIALHGYDTQTVGIVFTGARPGEKRHEQLAYDNEAIRPTVHPDIQVWEQPAPDPVFIQRTVDELSPPRRGLQPRLVAATVPRPVTPQRVPAAP